MMKSNNVSRRQFTKQSLGALGTFGVMSFASIGKATEASSPKAALPPLPLYMKRDPRLDNIFLELDGLVSDGVKRRGEKLLSLTPSSEMSMTFYSLYINRDKNLRSSGGVGIPTFLNPEDEQYVLTRFRMKYPKVNVYTAVRPYMYLNCHRPNNPVVEIGMNPLFDKDKTSNVVVIPSDSIGDYGYAVSIPRKEIITVAPFKEFVMRLDSISSKIRELSNDKNGGWMHVFM